VAYKFEKYICDRFIRAKKFLKRIMVKENESSLVVQIQTDGSH
jgi:hypothetical protein